MNYNIFRMNAEELLTAEKLQEFVNKNRQISTARYDKLIGAYRNDYEIYHMPKKPDNKPDNRLSVNFAKYITDTFNGFFVGVPIKVKCDDARVNSYINELNAYNNLDDQNCERSRISSIYGRAYEMYYVDSNNKIGITYLAPNEAFMIYDDSVLTRPLYFVRYYYDSDDVMHGSVSDSRKVMYFENRSTLKFIEDRENAGKVHGFNGVPAVETIENEERIGLFEGALPMMNQYNKTLSEKANDIDYFADAYMKVLGPDLSKEELYGVRDNRVINIPATDGINGDAEFMAKPNADTSQENMLDRLERQIFVTCMVANINDENFDAASGQAMRFRLSIMSNKAKEKERKFTAALYERYKLIFSNPISKMAKDDWMKINFVFTQNYPVNLTDEADIAQKLKGIVSNETLLGQLSFVDDVKAELERMEKETDALAYQTDYETARTTITDE